MKDKFIAEVRISLAEYNEIIEESNQWKKDYEATDEELCELKKVLKKAIETIKSSLLELAKEKYSYNTAGALPLYRDELLKLFENDLISNELLYDEFLEFKKQQEEQTNE